MMLRSICFVAGMTAVLVSCGNPPEQYTLPEKVTDFATLYDANCAGCHGRDGHFGAARALNDKVYLAFIGKDDLRRVIAQGVPGTSMPAYAQNLGGPLTASQINILTDQMEKRWSSDGGVPGVLAGGNVPPYQGSSGDSQHGEEVFKAYCASCHGNGREGPSKGGPVLDAAFLALASDQSLRTTVVVGRPEQGMPDWRSDSPGHPMTNQEIADVVSWLASNRATLAKLTKGGVDQP